MPVYLHYCEIDWGWQALSESERVVVRRYEALVQANREHTLQSFSALLATASRELPDRLLRARASDAYGDYTLVAHQGHCAEADASSFDGAGVFPEVLTPDDFQ